MNLVNINIYIVANRMVIIVIMIILVIIPIMPAFFLSLIAFFLIRYNSLSYKCDFSLNCDVNHNWLLWCESQLVQLKLFFSTYVKLFTRNKKVPYTSKPLRIQLGIPKVDFLSACESITYFIKILKPFANSGDLLCVKKEHRNAKAAAVQFFCW